ncbi:MAG: hypothetical protein HY609_01800, partial [Deltaproteobacteria bacterium]|nr:hypothetical protein [Deltaproteobacteria bacterium]
IIEKILTRNVDVKTDRRVEARPHADAGLKETVAGLGKSWTRDYGPRTKD